MGLFDQFPYTNFHELNLTWILEQLRNLETELENFINLNTIKYADPIQWNITTQYEANTVVIDPNDGTAYISVKAVPSGVALTNTDYWTPVFSLNLLSANQNITLRDDGSNVLSTFASSAGDWLIWNGILYKVTQTINVNESYVVGYNITRYTVENFISDYITAIKNSIGDLADLNTTDKSSIVNAINEVINNINLAITNVIGDLDDLNTTDKSSIVNAINELVEIDGQMYYYVTPEMYGAKGDGVTDDTQAFQDAFLTGKPVICHANKTYIVGDLDLSTLERIILLDGNHSTIKGASIQVNTTEDSTSWIQAYAWKSYIKNVHFIANGSKDGIHIGGGLKMEDCICDDYDCFCRFTSNYIDEVHFFNVNFRNYNRGDVNTPRVYHSGPGDQIKIDGTHTTGNVAYKPKYTYYFTYATGIAKNCISTGFHFGAASDFEISNSFFGVGATAEILVDNTQASIINVNGCVFAGVYYVSDGCTYNNCWFKEGCMCGGVSSKALTIDKWKAMNNCKISISNSPTNSLATQNVINSDYDDKNFDYSISSNSGVITTGLHVYDSDYTAEGVPQTGIYTYHVVPSMFPDALVRYKSTILSGSISVEANAGQSVVFVYNADYRDAYKHFYRENPDGTISHAVVPPTEPTLTGIRSGTMCDNGTCSGFEWETVSALPTLGTSSVKMVNAIVSATDSNLPTGTLYLDNGSVAQA